MPRLKLAKSCRRFALIPAFLAICACSFPGVYKLDIQQGNIVTQEAVDQLKPGMSKRQVRYLLGTPLLVDSFHEDRWDYFYSLKNHDDEYSQERLTLLFANDQLVQLKGNFRPSAQQAVSQLPTLPAAEERPTIPPSDVKVYPVSP